MSRPNPLRESVRALLSEQGLAVLATDGDSHPHTSLVALAAARDLRTVVFATPVYTRKYDNLLRNPRVALLVDNRRNLEQDFKDALALTVKGRAVELSASRRRRLASLYLDRHPYLEEFVSSPTCRLFAVEVESYSLVSSFQNVQEWKIPLSPSS
jgi:nitroimidazol reductase NimA-like FMN-containing flavoprotein (pyridoxamine 5'-phosphate oxidase superfamily)